MVDASCRGRACQESLFLAPQLSFVLQSSILHLEFELMLFEDSGGLIEKERVEDRLSDVEQSDKN